VKRSGFPRHGYPTAPKHPSPPPPRDTLEIAFAADGLPVQTIISQGERGVTLSATLDIPAINFPLTIIAPPASQTIGLKRFRTIERRSIAQARQRRKARHL